MSRTQPSGAYVARYGFNRQSVGVLLGGAVFTVLLIVLPDLSLLMRVAGLLLFGVGGLFFLLVSLRGGIAFLADEHGITLGTPRVPTVGMHHRELRVPWDSITAVVLFRQHVSGTTVPYVGLRLRPDAPATDTTFDPGSRGWSTTRALLPHVPEDVLARSRPVNGWRLDEDQLARTVAAYAPHVRIARLD